MTPAQTRGLIGGVGALAGLGFYVLAEWLPEWLGYSHATLFLGGLILGFFGSLMAFLGRVPMRTALIGAAMIAVGASLLLLWMGLRFEDPRKLGQNAGVLAFFMLIMLSWPFFITRYSDGGRWSDYERLFDEAWGLFVRGITALVFTGVFWLVFFLSSELLELVGIATLEYLRREELFWMPLTGLVFGLALAVLLEMTSVIGTLRALAINLLCLLLPPIAMVTLVFVVMVPLRGIEVVFRGFSAAGTLLGVAGFSVALIAASVGGRKEEEVTSRLMTTAARGLCLVLPLLAGLGCYAIWARVNQYGWSPERVLALVIALIVMGYAVSYALGAQRADWGGIIRKMNVFAALGVMVLCALWMTPVLDAYKISANNQVARFEAGLTEPKELALWELRHEWGKAGARAMAVLEGEKDNDALSKALARLETAKSKWDLRRSSKPNREKINREILANIPVRPLGRELTLESFKDARLPRGIANRCPILPKNAPKRCVALLGNFDLASPEEELVILRPYAQLEPLMFHRVNGAFQLEKERTETDSQALYDAILAGEFEMVPSLGVDLMVNGQRLEIKR